MSAIFQPRAFLSQLNQRYVLPEGRLAVGEETLASLGHGYYIYGLLGESMPPRTRRGRCGNCVQLPTGVRFVLGARGERGPKRTQAFLITAGWFDAMRTMQIIGSFRRLLLDVAVCGVVAVCIQRFPEPSLKSALVVGQFLPTVASCALFTYLCKHRIRALLVVAVGTFLGWVLCPTVWISYEFPNWYDDYAFYYWYWPVYCGVGALAAGLAIYTFECVASRRTPRDQSEARPARD
jgi:hypothetical protein